jgi:CubicO group peptidase (beta-lactamase class C family)
MKKICVFFAVALLLASTTLAAESDESRISSVEQGLRPGLRYKGGPVWSIEERMAHYNVPGVCIAIIEDFGIVWAKGYGVADVGTGEPVTESTLFQAASISKPVAAMAALRLVETGVLNLDEDVNNRLTSWKIPENEFTREEKVTLRRLLSHSAGLTVHGFRGYGEGEPIPTIIEVLDGKPPANSDPIRVDMVPGSAYRYSGGGYTVTQLLIENVTGELMHEVAQREVIEKIEMDYSSFQKPLPSSLAPLTSSAHDRDGKPFRGHWYLPQGSVCCGLWTTPVDLAKFAVEIQKSIRGESNRVISQDKAKLMVSASELGPAGLGLFLQGEGENVYFRHTGGNAGFRCGMIAHMDKGYGAALMTNSDNGGQLMIEIVNAIAEVHDWEGFLPDEYESVNAIVEACQEKAKENPADPEISEGRLNGLGYQLLGLGEHDAAIAVFALNVELNSSSANCYDSLAEAYMEKGDTEQAIANFKKALETLDAYPERNKTSEGLRERIPKILEQLGAR